MKKYKIYLAALAFSSLLFSFHLKAAVYTYDATIDIGTPWYISHPAGQWDYLWIISGAPTFTVQPGDTVQGTISFTGNEALQFAGPVNAANIELTWMDWANTTPNHTLSTTTLNGVTGSLTWPNPTEASTYTGGAQLVTGDAEIWTPATVSFTGFSYSATVVYGSGHYTPYEFSAYTPNDVPGAISVIPEPSMVALIGTGLMILLRRRRQVANKLKCHAGQRILS